MDDFEHCFVADSSQGWRASLVPLLTAWIDCLKQFAHDPVMGRHYTPFSYNERALVSFLAAAAWRSGFLAMEEFRTRKGRDRGFGRGDLVLKLDDTVLCLEAKSRGSNLVRNPDPWAAAGKMLGKAREDAAEVDLPDVDGLVRAGVVFVIPRIKAKHEARYEQLRQGLVECLSSHTESSSEPLVSTPDGHVADFWAAYLPADAGAMRQAENLNKRWMGIVLAGSTLDRW